MARKVKTKTTMTAYVVDVERKNEAHRDVWNAAWANLSAALTACRPDDGRAYHDTTVEFLMIGQKVRVADIEATAHGLWLTVTSLDGKQLFRNSCPSNSDDEQWAQVARLYWVEQAKRADYDHFLDLTRTRRRRSNEIAATIRQEFNISELRAVTVIGCSESAEHVMLSLGSYVKFTMLPDDVRYVLTAMRHVGMQF